MTSLPIHIPQGYILLVKKGDKVEAGQVVARQDEAALATTSEPAPETPDEDTEEIIDLTGIYQEPADKVRNYLQKSPGDTVAPGDVLAEKKGMLGISRDAVVAQVQGTVLRYEREHGRLVIRLLEPRSKPTSTPDTSVPREIISPLAGVVGVCHNDQIVIESESKALVGTRGVGGQAQGVLLDLLNDQHEPVESTGIGKETHDKILLVQGMTRDALAKASVIGVAGVIGVGIVQEDLDYLVHRRIDLPVIDVGEEVAKKLKKLQGKQIAIDGSERTIMVELA
jgi:hypothetical protein